MSRLFMLIAFLFILYFSWPVIENQIEEPDLNTAIEDVQSQVRDLTKNLDVPETIHTLYAEVQQILTQLGFQLHDMPLAKQENEIEPRKKVELTTPIAQKFSIHNVEIGDTKEDIDHNLGPAIRASLNEYGTNWNAYHENYQDFFLVSYDENDKVNGLYTNQDLIASSNGIKIGSSKESVRTALGDPLKGIQKGLVVYQFQENSDNDVFLVDDVYVTIFYDKHENNTVTALQLINKELEDKKSGFYTEASPALKEGFEYQMFDLTNAARVNHQLPILTWDDHVRETARKHSTDMAENNYFDHTNLEGQSPFDRMKEDDIFFLLAGENLAYGQFSSIFAHEGLMNSLGHRKNILKDGFEYLGVGVAFNNDSHPYYTQNYYAK